MFFLRLQERYKSVILSVIYSGYLWLFLISTDAMSRPGGLKRPVIKEFKSAAQGDIRQYEEQGVNERAIKLKRIESIQWDTRLELNWVYAIDSQNTQKLELQLSPEFTVRLSNGGKVIGITRIRTSNNNLQSQIFNRNYSSSFSKVGYFKTHTEIEMRELYFRKSIGHAFITLGKQQVVWGKSDGLKVLDVVNPQDFREFILRPFEESRIPLWTLNVEIPVGDSNLQLLWIPDKTYNILAGSQSVFFPSAPGIMPRAQPGVSVVNNAAKRPTRFFEDSDYGMRYTSFSGGWDISLIYLYHYQDTPVLFQQLSTSPQPTVTLNSRYIRSSLFGGAFSKAYGQWVFRSELGYSTDKYFLANLQVSNNGVGKSDEFAYVLGLDWSGIENTFISMQLFQSYIMEYSPQIIRDRTETTVTFLARRKYRNETVSLELLALHNFNNSDGLVRPRLSYDLKDDVKLTISMDLFYGNKNGLFGQFTKNDRVSFSVAFSF